MHVKKSLQLLKADLANKETTLKSIQHHYPHLGNLSEKQILAYFEMATLDELNTYIRSIQPDHQYHDHHNEPNISSCSCSDSQGKAKELYETEESAKAQIRRLSREKRVTLSLYRCPDDCGWHLTKR